MHYFLSLNLEHFYVGVLTYSPSPAHAKVPSVPIISYHLPSNSTVCPTPSKNHNLKTEPNSFPSDRPLIVHHQKQVLDIDRKAEEVGAKIGMALSEAKALLPGACFVAWDEEQYRQAQEKWLDVCAEFSDVIEPDTQCSAYLDLTGHPDPLAIAWQLQSELKQRLGWESRIGIAGTKWISRVAENVSADGEFGSPYEAACNDAASFLSPLKTKMLLTIPEEHRMRLRFLGYRTIGEVVTVPLSVLQEQFGREGLLIHQAAKGGVFQRVRAVYPKDSVSTRMRFEGGLDNREALYPALQQLAENLAELLMEREAQANELTAIIETEEGEKALHRKFMKPMQTLRAIYAGLKLLIDPIFDCGASAPLSREALQRFSCIRIKLSNLKPAERFQCELSGAHSASERSSSTNAAFNHIRTVFGDHAIEVASERKEPRRKLLMRAWKHATGWS